MEGFGILCEFLNDPGVYETVGTDPYTLFAPSDESFAGISKLLESLDEDDIYRVFLFHATPGVLTSDDLRCRTLLEMVEGGLSRTICSGEQFIQKGGGNRKNNLLPVVTETDIVACNGVVHVVSEVMLPNFIDEFDF